MIVVCERCSTRFQLDEARIPGRGAQVRCSRCKHAFFVTPPGTTADQVVQEVVAEATGPGGSTAPGVTTDLDRTLFDAGAGATKEQDEDEWEFNEDPPARSRARSARAPAAPEPELDLAKPPPPAAAEPEATQASASLLDELGNPEDWDFGGDAGAGAQDPAAGARAPAPEARANEASAPRIPAEPAARPKARAAQPRRRATGRMSNLLLEGVGFLAVALLFGAGIGRVVGRAASGAPSGAMHSAASLPVTGDGVAHVRVAFLENAVAGNLVVVSGQRTASQPGTGLEVEWMAGGVPIPGSATLAGPAVPTAWLREADPSELRTLLAKAAVHPEALPGGAPRSGAFVAVYDAVPEGATALHVSTVSLPSAPQAGEAAPGAALQGQAPVGAASPSSPPSPLPSSG